MMLSNAIFLLYGKVCWPLSKKCYSAHIKPLGKAVGWSTAVQNTIRALFWSKCPHQPPKRDTCSFPPAAPVACKCKRYQCFTLRWRQWEPLLPRQSIAETVEQICILNSQSHVSFPQSTYELSHCADHHPEQIPTLACWRYAEDMLMVLHITV